MNWIIRKSKKLSAHTYLNEVLKPLDEYIEAYNWILSDIEGGGNLSELPIDYEQDYFILSPKEFRKILNSHFQFYWGTIIAVPMSLDIKVNKDNLPYTEGNDLIWKNDHIQYPDAEIEIDCVDSGYTIAKFSKEDLSNKFKTYFDEAVDLEKFR
jgi:hypothetical protein